MDKTFIKALVIGLCTLKAIENGDEINKDLLVFIKGELKNPIILKNNYYYGFTYFKFFFFIAEIFSMRISDADSDGARYLSFPTLVNDAIKEIREKKYGGV